MYDYFGAHFLRLYYFRYCPIAKVAFIAKKHNYTLFILYILNGDLNYMHFMRVM